MTGVGMRHVPIPALLHNCRFSETLKQLSVSYMVIEDPFPTISSVFVPICQSLFMIQ